MGSVRVAIVGVGNCAASLVQGVEYYRETIEESDAEAVDVVQALRLATTTSLGQRDGLETVGETSRGILCRVAGDVDRRAEPDRVVHDTARILTAAQLGVVAISLLLAIPTAATRRLARRTPRTVGPVPPEVR